MEKNRESRNRPTRLCPVDFQQSCQGNSKAVYTFFKKYWTIGHPYVKLKQYQTESEPLFHYLEPYKIS